MRGFRLAAEADVAPCITPTCSYIVCSIDNHTCSRFVYPAAVLCTLRFRLAAEADLAPYISRVKDAALAHALSFGVGYVHETMPAIERSVVEFLFDSGAIQVGVQAVPLVDRCARWCWPVERWSSCS
jgi:hypothetical protein